MQRGRFIVVEGGEGAGKSTMAAEIVAYLRERGVSDDAIVRTREPGGTPIAEDIRKILKDIRKDDCLCPEAELLLMYAARVQLVKTVIMPALEAGKYVVGDRHDLSTLAYQGGGRGISRELIRSIRDAVLGDFYPDLTILMDIPPEKGLLRAGKRGELDRFEQEDRDFFERVRKVFLDEYEQHPDRIALVRADQDFAAVRADIRTILESKCIAG